MSFAKIPTAFVTRRRSIVLIALATASMVTASFAATDLRHGTDEVAAAPERDPWLRPFDSTSIWNMPIGSSARYVPANFRSTGNHLLETTYLMQTQLSDPLRPVMSVGSWTDRCSGTTFQNSHVRIPDGWRPKPVTPNSTPNNPGVFLQPDRRTLVNLNAVSRCSDNGPLHAYRGSDGFHITDLYGDGIKGGHGGSYLSQLGGAIRPGELSGDEPIRHALDLLVWAEHLYWGGAKSSSYRWPASTSDSYAGPDRYRGTEPDLRMGSLVAIPPEATPEGLGISTVVGRRLFAALQDYGAYITDDSAWNATYIGVDSEAVGTFPWGSAEQADMDRMVTSLSVVANNSPAAIGGGGTPRRPLLTPLPGADSNDGDTPAESYGRTLRRF